MARSYRGSNPSRDLARSVQKAVLPVKNRNDRRETGGSLPSGRKAASAVIAAAQRIPRGIERGDPAPVIVAILLTSSNRRGLSVPDDQDLS